MLSSTQEGDQHGIALTRLRRSFPTSTGPRDGTGGGKGAGEEWWTRRRLEFDCHGFHERGVVLPIVVGIVDVVERRDGDEGGCCRGRRRGGRGSSRRRRSVVLHSSHTYFFSSRSSPSVEFRAEDARGTVDDVDGGK